MNEAEVREKLRKIEVLFASELVEASGMAGSMNCRYDRAPGVLSLSRAPGRIIDVNPL